jgi:hypothetical protein
MNYKLSDQAVASVMMALQKSMTAVALGQEDGIDVTDMLRNFILTNSESGLVVENPPHISLPPQENANL